MTHRNKVKITRHQHTVLVEKVEEMCESKAREMFIGDHG